jgi:hypothetical protein
LIFDVVLDENARSRRDNTTRDRLNGRFFSRARIRQTFRAALCSRIKRTRVMTFFSLRVEVKSHADFCALLSKIGANF